MLNELRVHKETDTERGRFVCYQGDVWFFDEDGWGETREILMDRIPDVEDADWDEDFYGWEGIMGEKYPHILMGTYDTHFLNIRTRMNWRHTRTSTELKKISDLLKKPVRVSFPTGKYHEEDDEIEEDMEDTGTYYHGTYFSAMDDILKRGLVPGKASNFKVMHHDKVFITNILEKAHFHSLRAAQQKKDFPVILKLRIPDQSKLVSDYDVLMEFKGTEDPMAKELGYDRVYLMATGMRDKSPDVEVRGRKNFDRIFGTYGYVGRIPASHIYEVMIDATTIEEFNELLQMGEESAFDPYDTVDVSLWSELNIKEYKNLVNNLEDYDFGDFDDEEDD